MARSKKTIQEKVQSEFPEFVSETGGLSADQLNNKLATLAKYLDDTETAKENDSDLEQAQAVASELSAPYKEAKKVLKMKSKYVIELLKEKGAGA